MQKAPPTPPSLSHPPTITRVLYTEPYIIRGRIYILLTISQGRLEGAETAAAQIP